MDYQKIFNFIPEVRSPEEKKLDFKTKSKFTLIILFLFFILSNIPLFGLSSNALERFEYLAIILGTDFGSIISLGIGPIVMGSIILQLLTGAGVLNINTSTAEGKRLFQGLQKLLVFFFIIFESIVYVAMKGLEAAPGLGGIVILQLILGGLAIFYMDELCQKWGFGSGVSIFIAAGVSLRLFTSAFGFINSQSQNCLFNFNSVACPGKVFFLIQSLINPDYGVNQFLIVLFTLIATVLIFLIVVWAQSLKVEIPLSFGRLRGYGIKWPLQFFYASVIPVIFTAALMANLQLFGSLFQNAAAPCVSEAGVCTLGPKIASYFSSILGTFSGNTPISGLAFWIGSSNLIEIFVNIGFSWKHVLQGVTHILFYAFFATLFSIFWVKTSGIDSKAQAQKISNSGLQVAGFRQDNRILESILDRYIMPLTVMGGIAIGVLAAATDLLGALVSGTAMLLVIMIMFQLYQSIAEQHASDMNPMMKKFIGK